MSEIPEGRPYMVGRDFILAKAKWTVRKQPNGTWAAQSPAPYRPHPYVYDTWMDAYEFASTGGDSTAAALLRIQRFVRCIDTTGDQVKIRTEWETLRSPRPAIKQPSHTPPSWAIDVGKSKRNPRSTRMVK